MAAVAHAYLPAAAAGGGDPAAAAATTTATASAAAPSPEATKAWLKRLQNGSDVRGVALAAADEPATLTAAAVFFIAAAFVDFLRERSGGNGGGSGSSDIAVAIGCDPRLSGPLLVPAALAGLRAAGAAAIDVGLSTTPAMFYGLVADPSVSGSVMMTASHMPPKNNGLKFFTPEAGLGKPDVARVLELAAQRCVAAGVPLGDAIRDVGYVLGQAVNGGGGNDGSSVSPVRRWALLQEYAAHLRRQLVEGIAHPTHRERPLEGLKIAVDAGNGSGGFFATEVLAPLGADVSGSQFLNPDGAFPNHIPNPEDKGAMRAAVDAVKRSGADLGIVFDTDVDRAAIVDGDGTPINGNRFIALMAAIVLQDQPGTTIVTDSVTSNGLAEFIAARGGRHCRFKRGYKNVIQKGVDLNAEGVDCELMMETSGHGAMRSNRYLDDGSHLALTALVAYVRARLAAAAEGGSAGAGGGGKGGSSSGFKALLAELREPLEASEHRINVKGDDFKAVGAAVLEAFHSWVESGAGSSSGSDGSSSGDAAWSLDPVNHEGWRVNVDEGGGRRGWLLLRQSLHDPLLVLNVESDAPGGAAATRARALGFLRGCAQAGALDLSSLEAAV